MARVRRPRSPRASLVFVLPLFVLAVAGTGAPFGPAIGLVGCAEIVGFGEHELEPACGDGVVGAGEPCDDGNTKDSDGCSAACDVEVGYTCVGAPSACSTECGDGLTAAVEGCDDGDKAGGDGCSPVCAVELGYACGGAPSACEPVCGDGKIVGKESCDDANGKGKDGCDALCAVEGGFVCVGAPSACQGVCGDGMVVAGEGCDDGGTVGGDGCSGACAVEGGYACEGAPSACAPLCGDGKLIGGEACDDGNTAGSDGCSAACVIEDGYTCDGAPSACSPVCGDGATLGGEGCDDGDTAGGDGCSDVCIIETGYACQGAPSACAPVCGDGATVGGEGCDDGDTAGGDGCSAVCVVESGYACQGAPSACAPVCGDGILLGGEACDDGDAAGGDGCSAACLIEGGYACQGAPSVCVLICSNGALDPGEECDDGDTAALDGCSPDCKVEAGYSCSGAPSACSSTCGDGVLALGAEQCDDANVAPGDCCSATCSLEAAGCEVEPNNTSVEANDFDAVAVASTVKAFIKPATDKDVFRLTVPPSSVADLTAETLDGILGTTCASNNIDTKLTVADAMGMPIDADDDGGPGLCSIVAITGLLPGDYFVEVVDSPAGQALSFDYTLKIAFQVYECGNGVKEGPEQCDDGNTSDGDGCSSSCAYELEPEDEAGGNNSCADTSGPYTPPVIIAGSINPVGDLDYFAFTVPATADVRVETFGLAGPGTCPASVDTRIELRDQDCSTVLVADEDDGLAACSLINPSAPTDAAARHLPPGTYFLRVEEFGNNGTILPGYTAYITFTALCGDGVKEGSEECDAPQLPTATCDASCDRVPVCGDLYVDDPEKCDDGNTSNGDGCSATCALEGVVAEIEQNGTIPEAVGTGIIITGDTYITGSIGVIGDKDLFRMVLAQPSVVRMETFDGSLVDCAGSVSTTLRLLTSMGVELYADDVSGISACSALVLRLPAGTYFLQAEEWGNNAVIPSYSIEVDIQSDAGAEVEGNNNLMVATPLAGSDVFIVGAHPANLDADFFAVTVPDGWSIRAEIIEGAGETCESNDIDSLLTLFDPGGLQIAIDDDRGRGFCSLLDGTGSSPQYAGAHALPAGTYYLRVQASSNGQMGSTGQFDYRLVVTVRAP